MYDYRQDLQIIIQTTQNTEKSLTDSAAQIQQILDYARQIDRDHLDHLRSLIEAQSHQSLDFKTMQAIVEAAQAINPQELKVMHALQKIEQDLPTPTKTDTQSKVKLTTDPSSNHKLSKLTSKSHHYYIQRELNGGILIDENGAVIRKYPEQIIRDFNLQNNDEVAVQDETRYDIDHIIAHHDHLKNQLVKNPIIEFKYGIVEFDPASNQYYVTHNYNGPLSAVNSKTETMYIPNTLADHLDIKINSLVDLAWFRNRPDKVMIRWKHPENETPAPKRTPKKHSEYVEKDPTDKAEDKDPRQLDFNLHQQAVAIIVGDCQHAHDFERLIKAHNGKPVIIDAFYHQSDAAYHFTKQLAGCKYAILVQNYNKHNTSKTITDIISKTSIRFAIADSMGTHDVERAIYRAYKGYPAYESANNHQYPVLKK